MKNTPNKKPTAIKELLPKVEDLGKEKKEIKTLVAKFKLKQITWKTGSVAWNIVLEIYGSLSEAFINYSAKFTFDEEPYLHQIKTIENQIEEVQNDRQLFRDMQKDQIDDLKDELKEVEAGMANAKKSCPDVEFQATATKIDWTGNNPSVTFAVDSDFVEKLNREKQKVEFYKIELTPIKK